MSLLDMMGNIGTIMNATCRDNEEITQFLLNTMVSALQYSESSQLGSENADTDTMAMEINTGLCLYGYRLHLLDIPRKDILENVYYAKIMPDHRMLLSRYHPIRIMDFMTDEQTPETFKLLFNDVNYLPNIITVWDRGERNTVTLMTFQKLNIHIGSEP
jgi:hypothetical protein